MKIIGEIRKRFRDGIVSRDARVKLVGVYGIGGSGKTTLVKKIAEKVKEDGMFDVVTSAEINILQMWERFKKNLMFGWIINFM